MENKTPKEYADFLLDSFFSINDEEKSKLGTHPFIDREYAKECALLSLNNTIDNLKKLDEKWHDSEYAVLTSFFDYEIEYLEDAKQEIITKD